jgi:hypothetical protein
MGRPRKYKNDGRGEKDKDNDKRRIAKSSAEGSKRHTMRPTTKPEAEEATGIKGQGSDLLRLSNNVKSTFSEFSTEDVGTMAQAFFGYALPSSCTSPPLNADPNHRLVSSSPSTPVSSLPQTAYRVPQGTRFLYELRFQSLPASCPRTSDAAQIVQEVGTHELWQRLPTEIISLATAGIGSSYDACLGEPLVGERTTSVSSSS